MANISDSLTTAVFTTRSSNETGAVVIIKYSGTTAYSSKPWHIATIASVNTVVSSVSTVADMLQLLTLATAVAAVVGTNDRGCHLCRCSRS
jgi:hypothetical protein